MRCVLLLLAVLWGLGVRLAFLRPTIVAVMGSKILRELGSLFGDVHTHDVHGIHYLGTSTRAIVSSPGPGARGFDGRSEAATSSLRRLHAMAVGDAGANSLERWDAEQETNRLCVTATVTRQDDPPIWCDLCKFWLDGALQMAKHMFQKRRQQKRLGDHPSCDLDRGRNACDVEASAIERPTLRDLKDGKGATSGKHLHAMDLQDAEAEAMMRSSVTRGIAWGWCFMRMGWLNDQDVLAYRATN